MRGMARTVAGARGMRGVGGVRCVPGDHGAVGSSREGIHVRMHQGCGCRLIRGDRRLLNLGILLGRRHHQSSDGGVEMRDRRPGHVSEATSHLLAFAGETASVQSIRHATGESFHLVGKRVAKVTTGTWAQVQPGWGWRLRHSVWLLAPVLGVGCLSFIGFVYCAITVQTRRWIVLAAVTTAASVLGMILMAIWTNSAGEPSNAAITYVFCCWFAQIVLAGVVTKDYLLLRSR